MFNDQEALESFRQSRPDCIITDMLMPVMDGQELLSHIRELDSAIPVSVASADIQFSTRDQCEELGINAFINKPISPDELELRINFVLTQKMGAINDDIQ